MFCDRCGTRLAEARSSCPACGKALGPVPLMPARGRVAGHIRLLGIFWVAISAIRLIPGLALLSLFWGLGAVPPHLPDFLFRLGEVFGVLLLAEGALGLAAGWGLLERRPWARMLTIVLGCIDLIKVPVGTALGIYSLWVLLPAQSEQEYREMAQAA